MNATAQLCVVCGNQALAHALNGKPYCHRRECIDWKLVRLFGDRR
jgi:hypothetical protein